MVSSSLFLLQLLELPPLLHLMLLLLSAATVASCGVAASYMYVRVFAHSKVDDDAAAPPATTTAKEVAAAPFPAFANTAVSDWASHTGAAVPASFWGSEGHKRLLWTANVETRHPARRNGDLVANAQRPTNNLLMSTPEGVFYMGWSELHDSFQYYCDHSNMRRAYLELAAITFVRRFPTVLPDPANPLPDPALTDKRRFVLNQLQKGKTTTAVGQQQQKLVNDAAVQDRREAYQQQRKEDVAAAANNTTTNTATPDTPPTTADGIAAARVRRAIELRAAADPQRLVLDDLGGIVARGWSPELRELWLARTLGTLSFQRAGRMEDVFHTPKRSAMATAQRRMMLQRGGATKQQQQQGQTTTADGGGGGGPLSSSPLADASSTTSTSSAGLRSFGMKHVDPSSTVSATTSLVACNDMGYAEFKAMMAAKKLLQLQQQQQQEAAAAQDEGEQDDEEQDEGEQDDEEQDEGEQDQQLDEDEEQ